MKHLKWKIHAENKYIHLLVILVLALLISPAIEGPREHHFPLLSLVFLLSILFVLRALQLKRKFFLSCIGIGLAAFIFELVTSTCTTERCVQDYSIISLSIFAIFLAVTIIAMIHKMFSATKVTVDTILGGISVYLLIGMLWTIFYYLIYYFDRSAFTFSNRISETYLFYFSFTTLTTLGYGDAFPVNKFAMILTSFEAIVGQVYLAVFVARLVGLHTIKHSQGT